MLVNTAFLVASLSVGAFAKQAIPRAFRSRAPASLNRRQTGNQTWTKVDMWSVGPNWPNGDEPSLVAITCPFLTHIQREIDILEGVDATGTNKMTLHTSDGCTIDPAQQTGTLDTSNCFSPLNGPNTGCGVTSTDPTSYGAGFNAAQGGVFAQEWIPESGIRIWHFQRSNIPPDITSGAPNPDSWGTPAGSVPAGPNCDFSTHFTEHVLSIDTTICGDWAGSTYNTSGCPGTCAENASNFAAAKWQVNYIAVYN